MNFSISVIEEIKTILDVYYEDLKLFYYDIISSDYDYKFLLTRRAYVLYKIFETIFKSSRSEIPNGIAKETVGIIGNTHSVEQLLSKEESVNKKVLIIDDIIVNGRTIGELCARLKDYGIDSNHIRIRAFLCNKEARCIDGIKKMFENVPYISQAMWKDVSNRLTDVIVSCNIGYVSYVNSYTLHTSMREVIDSVTEKYYLKENVNEKFEKFGIKSKVLFFRFDNSRIYDVYCIETCLRFYERDNRLTVIPYVFLPALKTEYIYEYCTTLLAELDIDIPDCFDKDKLTTTLYKWTIYTLSNYLYKSFCEKYLKDTDCENILLYCAESYKINEHNCKKHDISKVTKDMMAVCMSNSDIDQCIDMLKQQKAEECGNDSMIVLRYLVEMRKKDEERAKKGQTRYTGIRICDICKVLDTDNTKRLLSDIINFWDFGYASYNIIETNTYDNVKMTAGFIRQGEQIYKAYYCDIHSDVYPAFHDFFMYTYDTREDQIRRIADYLDRRTCTDKFSHFSNNLYFDPLTSDIMTVAPNSSSYSEDIKEYVLEYVDSIYSSKGNYSNDI